MLSNAAIAFAGVVVGTVISTLNEHFKARSTRHLKIDELLIETISTLVSEKDFDSENDEVVRLISKAQILISIKRNGGQELLKHLEAPECTTTTQSSQWLDKLSELTRNYINS